MKAKDGLPVPVRLTEGLGRSRGFEGREPENAFFFAREDTGLNALAFAALFAPHVNLTVHLREAQVFLV